MGSLLRYIGGKTPLAKRIPFRWTLSKDTTYAEPFVGGGSVALMLASMWDNCKIVLNDADSEVVALWRVVVSSQAEFTRLLDTLDDCEPSLDLFKYYLSAIPIDPVERAFRFLYLNRLSRVESNGKRPLGGWYAETDDGLLSRWRPSRHQGELREARELLYGRTTIYNQDFADILAIADRSWKIYCDPPYYEVGDTLYSVPFLPADHLRLRNALAVTPADFVLSYGDHPRIAELYKNKTFKVRALNAHHSMKKREAKELIIVPNLPVKAYKTRLLTSAAST